VPRLDQTILHEIVRVVQTRSKVPGKVQIQKRKYEITYLDDHRQRIEEALRRHDPDRLNMLFGQLAGKVKYKLLRQAPARERSTKTAAARAGAARPKASKRKRSRAR
jgi:hypothetical protein